MQKDFFFVLFIFILLAIIIEKEKRRAAGKMKIHIFGPEKYIKIRLQLIEIERKIVQKGMWHTHGKRSKKKENIMGEQYS